jgi:hypothetical protein
MDVGTSCSSNFQVAAGINDNFRDQPGHSYRVVGTIFSNPHNDKLADRIES